MAGKSRRRKTRELTEDTLRRYVALAHGLGRPATHRYAIGTDAVEEAYEICQRVLAEVPRTVFFAKITKLHEGHEEDIGFTDSALRDGVWTV